MTRERRWELAATIVALIPIGFFLFFAVGEGASGIGHYLQAIPVAGFVGLGWWRPQIAGYGLIALSILFVILYATRIDFLSLGATVAVGVIFFLPLVASGLLFLKAHTDSNGLLPL